MSTKLPPRALAARAEKLRREIEKHLFNSGGHLTCSFGVAQWIYEESPDVFCRRVDDAMYAAKLGGRNKVKEADEVERRDNDCAPGAQAC